MKKVAVLKGGWSEEREVSLSSGAQCANALHDAGYDVSEIDVTRDLKLLIEQLTPKPDVVFNALHGKWGEDGCIQSVLDILQIAYTHSNAAASSLAMDKQKTKNLLNGYGIKSPKGELVSKDQLLAGDIPFAAPYVIKPNNEGSSFGVRIILEGDNRGVLGGEDWCFGEEVLIEEMIKGRELTVAVMQENDKPAEALTITEIKPVNSFYDFESKYADGGSIHVIPAEISEEISNQAKNMALIAHRELGCSGMTRSDFILSNDNELYFLELNTQPGMTPTSLAPEQAEYCGMDFKALVSWMVENAKIHD